MCVLFAIGILQYYDLSFRVGVRFKRQNIYYPLKATHEPVVRENNIHYRIMKIMTEELNIPKGYNLFFMQDFLNPLEFGHILDPELWGNIIWKKNLSFRLITTPIIGNIDYPQQFLDSIKGSDMLFYVGTDDLGKEEILDRYLEKLFARYFLQMRNYPYMHDPSVFDFYFKDLGIVSLKQYLEEMNTVSEKIKSQIKGSFSSFELVRKEALPCKPNCNLYIYSRKGNFS
jgi:hypothetical protein